ncbi:hypothetical protein KUV73_23995 [Mameliella alba]|nr:hypothetical protein [Mameliella alba]MBY6172438.1 hypothetical protein [Mameliella alba]MBY6177452.1 hypothetical protein [Mameliella alba]
MAFSFPLAIADFWDDLRISSQRFTLGENMETAETGGGEILAARTGPRLWQGEARIAADTSDLQDRAVAMIDLIRQPGRPFLVYDTNRAAPQTDRDGTEQGGAVCIVLAVGADRREVAFGGLPVGFALTRGDLLSIQYGANPTRFYLGRVVTGGVFSGGTPNFLAGVEVVPSLPEAITGSEVVTLRAPVCKAVYVPDSYSPPPRFIGSDGGLSFKWRQTLR